MPGDRIRNRNPKTEGAMEQTRDPILFQQGMGSLYLRGHFRHLFPLPPSALRRKSIGSVSLVGEAQAPAPYLSKISRRTGGYGGEEGATPPFGKAARPVKDSDALEWSVPKGEAERPFPHWWQQAETYAEEKKVSSYDLARDILVDLRDAYVQEGRQEEFTTRLQSFASKYARRPALMRRLKDAGMEVPAEGKAGRGRKG